MQMDDTIKEAASWLMKSGLRILGAGIFLLVGFHLIKLLRKALGRSMEKAGVEVTLRKFLDALVYAVLLGSVIFIAADWAGFQTTSIITLIGAVGVAMSLSLQNTLANFAGGCMILFLKPFKAGDYLVTSSGEGTVESIGLVYTTLMSTDNRKIVIPNNSVAGSAMINQTGADTRRLILDISVSYSADLRRAKEVLQELFEESPYILKEEEILIVVKDLAESSVVVSARGWTKTEDYWTAGWELREKIKYAFDEEKLAFAYPSRNVYIKEEPDRSE